MHRKKISVLILAMIFTNYVTPTTKVLAYELSENISKVEENNEKITRNIPIANMEQITYLSDIDWKSATCGWRTTNKDKSIEGNPLRLTGKDGQEVEYEKGIGTHAPSTITYDLTGKNYSRFTTFVGVDREMYNSPYASIEFQVYVDGVLKYESGLMHAKDEQKYIDLSIDGAEELKLVVTNGGNGNGSDHASFGDAKLYSADEQSNTEIESIEIGKQGSITFTLSEPTQISLEDVSIGRNNGNDKMEVSDLTTKDNKTYNMSIPYCEENNYKLYITLPNNKVISKDFVYNYTYPNALKVTYLSDIDWNSATCGWRTINKDKSIEGNPLRLTGKDGEEVEYEKGIGTHAPSTITYDLTGRNYSFFSTNLGVDREMHNSANSSLEFKVYVNGELRYESGLMDANDEQKHIVLNIRNAEELKLVVTDGENGNGADHASFGDAKFYSADEQNTKADEQNTNDLVEVQDENGLKEAIKDNANIKLKNDIAITDVIEVRAKNVTIDGAGFKLKIGEELTKNPFIIRGSDNTIKNLVIEDYSTIGLMGISSSNLTLENLTLNGTKNKSSAGIDLSGCKNANLKNITTSNHKQAGIRLKNASSVEFLGGNKHISETNQMVVVDSSNSTFEDDTNQYTLSKTSNDQKIYYIKERIDVNSQESLEKAITVPNSIINITSDFSIDKPITIENRYSGITINGENHTISCGNNGKITVKASNTNINSLTFNDYLNAPLVIYGAKNVELKDLTLDGNSIQLEDGSLRANDNRSKVGLDIANRATVTLDGIESNEHSQKAIFVRGTSEVTFKNRPKHFNDTVHLQTVQAKNESENIINYEGNDQYQAEQPITDEKGRTTTNYYTKETIAINSVQDLIDNARNSGMILSINSDLTFDDSFKDQLNKLDPHPFPQFAHIPGFERALGLNILQNIVIEGNDHTINLNNICGLVLKRNDSTINNLKVENSSGNGISVYNSTGIELNNVTVKNSTKSGIVANGSIVDLIDCETINNAECGVMSTRSRTLDNPDNPGAYRDSVVNIMGSFEQQEPNVPVLIRNLEMIKSKDLKQNNQICFKEPSVADKYNEINKPEIKAKLSLLNLMIFKDWFEEHHISFDTEFGATDTNFMKKQTKIDVTKPNESKIQLDNTGQTDNTEKLKELLKYAALNSKELYFPEGTYKISGDIDLTELDTAAFSNVTISGDKDGLSILDASSVEDKMVLIKNNDYHARMGYVNINNMVFNNVGLDFNGVYKNDISLNNNAFLNGRYSVVDGKAIMTPYITANNSTYLIEGNIFLRGKDYAGRGISTYGTKDSVIKDNFFGKLENKDKASEMLPDEVMNKLNLINNTLELSGEQGNFFTCINNERYDKNMTIKNNYMHMNDSREIEGISEGLLIGGIDIAKDGPRKDHIIYAKGYEGLNIVGNYFEGMENGAAGGVKLRNGVGAYVGANYFEDVPLLTYIYKDLTKEECRLYDTTIYNNVFHETKNIGEEGTGILYYQNFQNGETVTFPDGTVDSNAQGDIKNFVVYKNQFLSGKDSFITISNRAENFKDQFYMNGNVYKENNTPVNLQRGNLSIEDVSEDVIQGKLNEGYAKFKDVNIPLLSYLRVDNSQLSKKIDDTNSYIESIKDKTGDKEGQYSEVLVEQLKGLLDEAKEIVSDESSTQWTINNKLMDIKRLVDKINRDINVDDAMLVNPNSTYDVMQME